VRDVRYLRIYAEDGKSRLEDVEVAGELREIVAGVPPLLVSAPAPVNQLVFVSQPADATDWDWHVAPRRQWVIVVSGRGFVEVEGERRELEPGSVVLAEDTTGAGHLSGPLSDEFVFLMVPLAD
jgi:quercetin dioxygenase-like cupin family protein